MLPLAAPARTFGLGLLERCLFPSPATAVTCAVSGGADSMALLVLARLADLEVTAVHVDHGLRPGSAAEADIVGAAATQFGASFRSERVNLDPGSDLEARARTARRSLIGPDALTGHTQDDQAETVLINLLRGSGVSGLAAMTPGGIHPILALRRSETVELCALAGLEPVQDPSNQDPRFVRNRVRHEVLPLLAQISQRDVTPLLARTADRSRSMQAAIAELAAELDPTDTRGLKAAPQALVAESLRQWLRTEDGHPPSSAELERVLDVVFHRSIACELSGGRRVARTDGILRIEATNAQGELA